MKRRARIVLALWPGLGSPVLKIHGTKGATSTLLINNKEEITVKYFALVMFPSMSSSWGDLEKEKTVHYIQSCQIKMSSDREVSLLTTPLGGRFFSVLVT